MVSKLTREAYERLIAEDIAWLMQQPRTLERDHIKAILEHAVEYEYGPPWRPVHNSKGEQIGMQKADRTPTRVADKSCSGSRDEG